MRSLSSCRSLSQHSLPSFTRASSIKTLISASVFFPDLLISSQSGHLSTIAETTPVMVLGSDTFLWYRTQIMCNRMGTWRMPYSPHCEIMLLFCAICRSCLHSVALSKYFVMYSFTLAGSKPVISASTSMYGLSSFSSLLFLEVIRIQQLGRLLFMMALSMSQFLPGVYSSCPSNMRRTFCCVSPLMIFATSAGLIFCLLRPLCCFSTTSSIISPVLINFKAIWKTRSNCFSSSDSLFAQKKASCFSDVDLPTPPWPG